MFNDSQGNQIEQNDKSFLEIFLNQARLNAHITLCHISDLLGENTVDEDSLATMPVLGFLESDKDAVKSERTFELVEKHFPMLKVIYGSGPKKEEVTFLGRTKKYKEILGCFLKAVNGKRNEYCHAYSKSSGDYDIKTLTRHLENCFDASVRKIKEIRSLEEEEVFHLRRKTSEGKGKEKRVVDNPNFHYHFKNEEGQLSEKGLAFLVAMFLEKKDAYLFLKRQHGFHRGESPGEKATLESFCVFRIRLPKPVMTSDVDKNGLALDMLNDLKKCPKELFELLAEEKQQEFRVTDSEDGDEDGNEILMRRYSDRFPYFALRYCDENEVFKNIRFHIDLGRYYFKFYEKETIDGNKYQRALDKRLKTFGRIKDVKNKVRQEWGDIIKAPDEISDEQNEPYKTNSTPHYNLVDNQIGFTISGDCKLPDVKQPEGKILLQKPDAWLSIYELPGMLFHGLGYGFKKTESLIEQYIIRQRKICEEIFRTGTIPANAGEFLPNAIKEIGTGNETSNEYAKNKLDRKLSDTRQRIRAIKATKNRIADKSNKPGKRKFFDIRAGKLADFLARDIMALQEFDPAKEGKDKLTSINFQVLQATLAFYGAKKNTLAGMFKRIGLLEGDNPHPFMKEIEPGKHNSIVGFYEAYLDRKEAYLEECRKGENLDNYQFLRPSRQRYAKGKRDLKTITRQLLDNPVNIPNGFFREEIREFVCEQDAGLKSRKMNTAYMVGANFEKTYGGQQPFQYYQRNYPVVLKAQEYCKKRENRGIAEVLRSIAGEMSYREMEAFIKKEIPDNGRFEPENLKRNLLNGCKDFKKNERLLRRYKVQDMVAFAMVEKTLKEQLSFDGNVVKLEAITPTEESLFKKPILCSTDIAITFNTKPTHYDNGYVGFIQEKYAGHYASEGNKIILKYRIISENTKLKDIGKYRRYLYDRRLPGLLIWKYAPNAQSDIEIKYSEIEEEIKAYEQYRLRIAEQLYVLETKVIDCYICKDEPGEDYISFNGIIDTIKAEQAGSEEKCDTLLSIRNAVYHNQFPAFMDAIEKTEGDNIAGKMLSITEDYVKCTVEQMNEGDKEFVNV